MYKKFQTHLKKELDAIESAGLFKKERVLTTPQGAEIKTQAGLNVLNFCANNYLGLSNSPELIETAKKTLDSHGYGMSSVRFICGTTDLHKELEERIARFFHTEDTILYAAAFDANGGVFEPLLTNEDAIISDSLNHASIIDGVRLCKAKRFRYTNADLEDLEDQLIQAQPQRYRIIVTDGVFSMDGNVAPLDKILALAEQYDAMVMVDESHSAGVIGDTGRGTTEYYDVLGKVEIISGTLGKAFGGAIGGFTTGKKEIIDMLRQRSRPYLFSNSIPPIVAAAGIEVMKMMEAGTEKLRILKENTRYFAEKMIANGFDIKPTKSAICAVMLYDAKVAQEMAARLLDEGIYVIGFYFPVVPQGEARIRVQLSAAHSKEHLDKAIEAFKKVGKDMAVI
ncbi:MAG: glycine C-acetyltransferase [Bacteroidetes bacterium]|jgi:glycine C-acetyltransferase|nr:glycine C-acetyltransferase [Bacteroidota bacterium]MBT3747905.1 glycine C-acetyltransferase [Bacteroidota bacterium]MBT4410603.1 glycine C-acetyltransferase [Bacteroidota bacterium]MBT7466048.1 glycine C-acetyltransferase [Bacteroidota bacterium]